MFDYNDIAREVCERRKIEDRINRVSVCMYNNGVSLRAIARCFSVYFKHSENDSLKFVSRSIYEAKLKGECNVL